MKQTDKFFLTFLLAAFALFPAGCDFLDTDEEVYQAKTRTALFTVAPAFEQTVVTHPGYPAYTTNWMVVTEDGTGEPIKIAGVDGFTYEEGYEYKIRVKVISHPRVDDMILTGQRKHDWGNLTPLEYSDSYEFIEILSKTKVNDSSENANAGR